MKPREYINIPQVLVMDAEGYTFQEILHHLQQEHGVVHPKILRMTTGLVAGILRDYRNKISVEVDYIFSPEASTPTFQYGVERPVPGALPLYDGHLRLKGDALIVSDFHCPFEDWNLLAKAREVALSYGLTRTVIAGDLLSGDSVGKFKKLVPSQPAGVEIAHARAVMEFLLRFSEEVIILPGNHDRWLIYHIDGQISFSMYVKEICDGLEGITITEYDRIYMQSGDHLWIMPHQANYSKVPGKVGRNLVEIEPANYFIPHQHYNAVTWTPSGFLVIDIGGMYNRQMFGYSQLTTSTTVPMVPGFGTLRDGVAQLHLNDSRVRKLSYGG